MKIRKKIITLCAIALLSISVITAVVPSNNAGLLTTNDTSHGDPM